MKKKCMLLVLAGICIAAICNMNMLLEKSVQKMNFTNIFLAATFDCTTMFKYKSLVLIAENMFMLAFMVIVLGNNLARDIHGSGIYYILHSGGKRNRTLWYLRRIARLGGYCFIYILSYLGSVFLIIMKYLRHIPTQSEILILMLFVCVLFILLYFVVLVTNIAVVLYGEAIGVGIGVLLLFLLLKICLMEGNIELLSRNVWMRYLNPAYAVTLYSTHSVKLAINAFIVYLIEGILLVTSGKVIIHHMNLYGNKREAEG